MEIERQLGDLRRQFAPPLELGSGHPRDVVLTGAGRALVATALVLLATAVGVAIGVSRVASKQADNRRVFNEQSIPAPATVTRLWRGTGDSRPAWVSYHFAVAGAVFDGSGHISLAYWRTLAAGSRIPVRYVPGNPTRNVAVGAEPHVIPRALPILLGAGIACLALLCGMVLSRQRRLLTEGRAAPALVTGVAKYHTSHGGSYRSITYAFPLLSGAVATGRVATTRKAPDVGGTLCVIYDPERPTRSQPYPLPLVKPARA